MPLWLDLLKTPMAAPETRELRRLRLTWQTLCLASAAGAGCFGFFHRVAGRNATVIVVLLIAATAFYTALYLLKKGRADQSFLERLGSAE